MMRASDRDRERAVALLRALDGAWLAVDLGSSNGTWLMGRRVGRARVSPGDELVLGDCAVVLEPVGR